jgi:hypothetical protein
MYLLRDTMHLITYVDPSSFCHCNQILLFVGCYIAGPDDIHTKEYGRIIIIIRCMMNDYDVMQSLYKDSLSLSQ